MEGMMSCTQAAVDRAMNVEVILCRWRGRSRGGKRAEILGISDRQMRRSRGAMRSSGSGVCLAAGGGKPSPKKVPLAVVERVLGLCES
jgi:hypothetical protein